MSIWIYGRVRGVLERSPGSSKLASQLKKLHPGKEVEQLLAEYYAGKLELALCVVLAGSLLALLVGVQSQKEEMLLQGQFIERGDYREADRSIKLNAAIKGYPNQTFQINIKGTVPDKEVVDRLEEEFWLQLKEEMLMDNLSLESVSKPLKLNQELAGYPFLVKWSSASPDIVDDSGQIKNLAYGEKERAVLTARISYEKWEWTHDIAVTVISPMDEIQMFYQELEFFLEEQEENNRNLSKVELPKEWQGKPIRWEEQVENNGFLLWILTMVTGMAVFVLKDKDLDGKVMERQKQLKSTYPMLLHKLELYLEAGLTTRGALVRIAEAYLEAKAGGKESNPAYEEVIHTCRELGLGMAEIKAYEGFGERCGIQEYVRLGALLSQNVLKGSKDLPGRLKEEAQEALKEQISRGRQLGEEASTKLLVPMIMMLGMTMAMIMIPAFGSL